RQQNLVETHSVVLQNDYPNTSKKIFGCIQAGNDYIVFNNKKLYYQNIITINIRKLYLHEQK
ncbi:MAG: hypothetical protein LUG46_00720, partial [Erysipelotrichaceae bacterium]|nr:hypothetical protein [Erysipelotrichaceae bacterium]